MFYYQVYGLTLQVNQPLAGLIPAPANAPVDVRVALLGRDSCKMPLGEQARWIARYDNGIRDHNFKMWSACGDQREDGEYVRLRYAGRNDSGNIEWHEFVIDPSGSRVWATWTAPRQDMVAFLLGPVLAGVLRLRGTTCLHASVVAVAEQSIAILGPKGAGKSTTAAAFSQFGMTVLADDMAALVDRENRFLVQPGYPRLRLVPQAATTLMGSSETLPRVFYQDKNAPDKHYLDLTRNGQQFPQHAYPLSAIYLLGTRKKAHMQTPFITPIPATRGLMTLVQHTSANFMLDRAQRANEFKVLARLATHIPLRQIHRPDDLNALPQLCEVILNDVQSLRDMALREFGNSGIACKKGQPQGIAPTLSVSEI